MLGNQEGRWGPVHLESHEGKLNLPDESQPQWKNIHLLALTTY